MRVRVCVSVQEPGSVGELGCGFYGLPCFLSWLCASQPWLLQRLLGFPVLPRHCQLPVFPTEGKKKEAKYRISVDWSENQRPLDWLHPLNCFFM